MNIFLCRILSLYDPKRTQISYFDIMFDLLSIFFLISAITSTIKDNKIEIINNNIGNGFNLNNVLTPSTYNTSTWSKIPIIKEIFKRRGWLKL